MASRSTSWSSATTSLAPVLRQCKQGQRKAGAGGVVGANSTTQRRQVCRSQDLAQPERTHHSSRVTCGASLAPLLLLPAPRPCSWHRTSSCWMDAMCAAQQQRQQHGHGTVSSLSKTRSLCGGSASTHRSRRTLQQPARASRRRSRLLAPWGCCCCSCSEGQRDVPPVVRALQVRRRRVHLTAARGTHDPRARQRTQVREPVACALLRVAQWCTRARTSASSSC